MSLTMNAFNQDTPFLEKFTLFYWGWWVTWAPYVGVFAARISRGRTVREFVLGMLIVPSLINIAWFAIVGASAIDLDRTLGGAVSAAAQSDPAVGLFAFLQYYPLPILTALVAIFLLWIFFVAGADAATIVLGSMSVGGVTDPRRFIRLAWGVIIAAFAAVLLLIGGLEALQRAAILAGLPFGLLMVFMCWALYRALRRDALEQGRREESQETEEPRGQPPTSARE
jgi:glycine betaine transporter